jgi:glycosyltransferase involved in cell wall biosynthesis
MTPLNVVYLNHVARMSGGEIALLRLISALGDSVRPFVVLGEDGPLAEALSETRVEVAILPLTDTVRELRRANVTPSVRSLRAVIQTGRYVRNLSQLLRRRRPDIVHANSLKSGVYGGVAARATGIPLVWHVRDRVSADYLPGAAAIAVRAAARLLPTALIANSHATMATLPQHPRSRVVYDPVEPPQHASTRGERPDDRFTVGMIGRLAPWKGQMVFLEAFARAFDGRRVNANIVGSAMFGEDDYEKSLRAAVQNLGIAHQVDFRGFRTDVWAELATLDVLVHCSTTPEPFGQVLTEAMAAGVPVIASAAGGPLEIVQDGVNGLLCSIGDAEELAGLLDRLYGDPALRERLATGGRERSKAFSPERAAAGVLEIYRQAGGGS